MCQVLRLELYREIQQQEQNWTPEDSNFVQRTMDPVCAYIHIYACTAANLHNALKASKRSVKALFFLLQNLFSYILALLPRLVTAVTAPGLCFVCPIHILCLDSHEGGNIKIPIYKNLQRKKHLSWNLSSDAMWGGRIPR